MIACEISQSQFQGYDQRRSNFIFTWLMAILPAACWADGFGFDNESMASALELAMTLALKLEIFDYVSTMCIAEPLIQQG
jgi:hypothetical protein